VVPVSASPTVTLVSGITAVDDYLRISAYRELSELARDSSPAAAAARTALFTDQKHNPTLWAVIARRTLVLLGVDYQRLLARGKEPEKCRSFIFSVCIIY
jgi:nucleoporin NDC1